MQENSQLEQIKQESLLAEIPLELLASPDELELVLNNYFEKCKSEQTIPTIAGLGLSLGLSRKELLNFTHHDPKIRSLVRRAIFRLEDHVEQRLLSGQPASGPSLWLRNNSEYTDKRETEVTHKTISNILDEIESEDGVLLEDDE